MDLARPSAIASIGTRNYRIGRQGPNLESTRPTLSESVLAPVRKVGFRGLDALANEALFRKLAELAEIKGLFLWR